MQKKFLLLAFIVCFSASMLKSSSEKQPRMTIGESFIALLKDKSNQGKSLKQLEAEVWRNCTWEDISEQLGKKIPDHEFLQIKLPKNIAQMHAIFKVQMLMKVCSDIAKRKGIKVEEEYGENFNIYVACVKRMNK